jgi:glycerol-3-phosphate dehydrogenase
MAEFDLAIIGGGIMGAAIARDAAGRGLRVLLVEQGDLASGASSASTKLINGDLAALERGALASVRAALRERDVLLRTAAHVVRPTRLVLLPQGRDRAAWIARAELLLYDHVARRGGLAATRSLDLTHHVCGAPLRRRFTFGFEFSDARVDDARLVILNALDAAARGAVIRTRTRCLRAERADAWTLVLNARGRRMAVTAGAVVNATGAWLAAVNETVLRQPNLPPVRFVKGSHILVRSLFAHDRGYVLPSETGPPVYALPFGRQFTLIGATYVDFRGDPGATTPDIEEVNFLCAAVNGCFRENITPGDVVWSFAGVAARHDVGA